MYKILFMFAAVLSSVKFCSTTDNTKTLSEKHVSRIIQGWPARDHQFPHQAHLLLIYNTGGHSECGGSLITNSFVLTSAQCIESKLWAIVRLGHSNVTTPGLVIQANIFIKHPNFDKYTYNNDLALINLGRYIPVSDSIKPVRLPRLSQLFETFENETATVSGWGYKVDGGQSLEYLNFVELRVISRAKCLQVYNPSLIKNTTICAVGKENDAQGTCFRDTGGPMTIIDEDGELTQIGVISFAAGYDILGCASKLPSGYTRISYYIGWIAAFTKDPPRP